MRLDLDHLVLRARQAAAAYLGAEAQPVVKYPSFGHYDFYGTQAYLAWNDEEIVVCFRGSDELIDWVRNLKAYPRVDFHGNRFNGRVHRGFYQASQSIPWNLRTELATQINKKKKLVLVGHSLGAALAVLMAERWLPQEVWLFGCPRVGNLRFADRYNTSWGNVTYNIRAMPDVVPLSPLLNSPVGQQFTLWPDGSYDYFPSMARRLWEHTKALGLWAVDKFTKAEYLPPGIRAHFADSYVFLSEQVRCNHSADS